MRKKNKNSLKSEHSYRVRILSCIAAAELIALAFVLFWPVPSPQEPLFQDEVYSDNNTPIEEITRTSQESKPPPPPVPPVPVEVPNDEVIEEDPIDFSDVSFDEYADSLTTPSPASEGSSERIAANPQLPPSVVRIVEPTLPRDFEKNLGQVVITIRFLVNSDGSVDEATIERIRKRNDDGSYTQVRDLNSGILAATLKAAHQWRFRPARNEGVEVRTFTTADFTLEI